MLGLSLSAVILELFLIRPMPPLDLDIFLFCLFLIQISIYIIVCVCSVAQLYLTLCNPMDSNPLESSVHGIFQARILEWVAIPFSRLYIIQIRSVAQSCLTLCDLMNHSTPGLPVHHQLPEFTQTHLHRVSDAIQPSHPLSSPSPPAPNPSQHQSLFQ